MVDFEEIGYGKFAGEHTVKRNARSQIRAAMCEGAMLSHLSASCYPHHVIRQTRLFIK